MIKSMSEYFLVCSGLKGYKYSFNPHINDNDLIKLCESEISYKFDDNNLFIRINEKIIKRKISDLGIHFIDFKNPGEYSPEVCSAVLRIALLVEKLRKAGYLCFFHGVSSKAAATHELLTSFKSYNLDLAFNMLGVKKLRSFGSKINRSQEIIKSRDEHSDKFEDNNYSKYLISCDGDFNNQDLCESAMYFFLNNRNIKDIVYKQDIIKKIKSRNFKFLVSDMITNLIKSNIKQYGGQIYVIAIQENLIDNEQLRREYVYRSHPCGIKCNCLFDIKCCDNDRFMYVLKNNNDGKTDEYNLYCEYNKSMPQYRLFASGSR